MCRWVEAEILVHKPRNTRDCQHQLEARRGLEQSSLQPTHTSALSPIQNDFRSGPAVEGGKEARWIASLAFASGVLRYLVSQVQIALVLEGLKAGSNFLFHLCLP